MDENRVAKKGHKGHTLEASDKPDKIKEYAPIACENCGKDLTNVDKEFIGSRQTIELPEIKPVYIQHNIYQRKCSCGCSTEESFPQEASAPVSYGPSVEGLVGIYILVNTFLMNACKSSLQTY